MYSLQNIHTELQELQQKSSFVSKNHYICVKIETKMNFIEFKQIFEQYPVFSIGEIEKYEADFNKNNLLNWQNKNYLQKIRNGWYRINTPIEKEEALFYIANKIYSPSYISLESALAYHELIPEQSFSLTSVTNRKTQTFNTEHYAFSYRNLKYELIFGYQLRSFDNFNFKIAEPEKALLDFLYLHPEIQTRHDLAALRINKETAKDKTEPARLRQYTTLFKSNVLQKKSLLLEDFIYA